MKYRIFLVLLSVLALTGCSSTANKVNGLETQVSVLTARVSSMEQRQSALEGQSRGSDEAVGYLKGKVDSRGGSPTVIVTGSGAQGVGSGKKVTSNQDIQAALKNAGFYHGPVDGKIGKTTRAAIKEFQRANGIKVSGKAGTTTKERLQQYL